MNDEDSPDQNSLEGFYAYKDTFDGDTIWVDISRNLTFINTPNPYLDPYTLEFDTMSAGSLESSASFGPWPLANMAQSQQLSFTSYHNFQ
ncbi:hypothetical protein HBH98_161940 [Parastagonospora nodorum]|nr:hypothetical protein HBH53_258820 [Parastagonospora nodorum]KAH3956083.1 hypothetical protein HBH51_256000 [Parastagonospora nodorum]KAH4215334.1 hypothetical protein HBI06_256180 [Parastagonospora nodorum]KAH4223044.1 hypothetical protein HBI05_251980 [Parastagonospora nodorum]KAH4342742.1 hypothetical protein HBH98_161940 [Parastagonospora nodorum]